MKISLSNIFEENNKQTLQEIATYISDLHSLGQFYRLDRKIKELKKMQAVAPNTRTLLCWREAVLFLEAIRLRLGELHIKEMRELVRNERTQQQD